MTEDKYESLSPYYRSFDAVRDFLPDGTYEDEQKWSDAIRAREHLSDRLPARPERHLYAAGEALAEERRAHRQTEDALEAALDERDEAKADRWVYYRVGFVTGLLTALVMSVVAMVLG